MALIRIADFALMLDPPLSKVRVYDFLKRGDIVQHSRGMIDTDHPTNAEWLKGREGISHQPKPPHYKGHPKPDVEPPAVWPPVPPPPPPVPAQKDKVDLLDPNFDAESMLDVLSQVNWSNLTKADADKARQVESMLKLRVEREHKRGLLIERTLVQTIFSRMHTIDSNEFRTLATNVSPEIAAALEVDDAEKILQVEKIIDSAVMKTLGHCKRLLDDFLIKRGGQPVRVEVDE